MTGRFTLDASILVYAIHRAEGGKHERAIHILDRAIERDCILTIQALAEFYWVVARKRIVPDREARGQVRDWLSVFPTVSAQATALHAAMSAVAEKRHAFWDAMLLATARDAGCSVLLSDDMQEGASFGGITICNPFLGTSLPPVVARLLGLGPE